MSDICTGAFFLRSCVETHSRGRTLRVTLVGRGRVTLRSRLGSLGLRVGPRFVFGGFGGLLRLVRRSAGLTNGFLDGLSGICQCVVAGLSQGLVPIESRVGFLRSCLCLVRIHRIKKIIAGVDLRLGRYGKCLPPTILRLLIRGTVGRGNFSVRGPLFVSVALSSSCVAIHGLGSSLLSGVRSANLNRGGVVRHCSLLYSGGIGVRGTRGFCSIDLPVVGGRSL